MKLTGASMAFLMLVFVTVSRGQTQQANVAIFLYDGMELLDFAGPAEVFAATDGINVFSITVDGKPVTCNHTGSILNAITPDFAMDDAPATDVIVFPGGGTGVISKNTNVINWLKKRIDGGTLGMSVCTGASVLANTGLLAGKNVTTWYGFIPALQAAHPELKVLQNTRYVDNGNLLTTAGVSAGIDGALHLVSRIKGRDVAAATAKYMEYDKWDPMAGQVDNEHPYLKQLRENLARGDKHFPTLQTGSDRPFEGEFRNIAFDLLASNKPEQAASVLKNCLTLYPDSKIVKIQLASVNRTLGRPAPVLVDEESIVESINRGNVEKVFAQLQRDERDFPGYSSIRHGGKLTHLGIQYYEKQDYKTALRIFELIALADPGYGSFYNVGELHAKIGNNKDAIVSYKRALTYKPGDEEVTKIVSDLESGE